MKHFTALWTLDSGCANTVIYTTLNLIRRSRKTATAKQPSRLIQLRSYASLIRRDYKPQQKQQQQQQQQQPETQLFFLPWLLLLAVWQGSSCLLLATCWLLLAGNIEKINKQLNTLTPFTPLYDACEQCNYFKPEDSDNLAKRARASGCLCGQLWTLGCVFRVTLRILGSDPDSDYNFNCESLSLWVGLTALPFDYRKHLFQLPACLPWTDSG